MRKNKINILSTKKLSPGIVEQAKEKCIDVIEVEFISVKSILTKEKNEEVMPVILSKAISNISFTSANAVEAIKSYLHQGDTWFVPNWNIFCLSGKTKEALTPYVHPNKIIATAENASALAQKIIENEVREIVFFCGNQRRDELPDTLRKAGITVEEIAVYETMETPHVAQNDVDGILFFSPSAVKSFFSANQVNKDVICFSIGTTTAASIKEYTDNKIITSESPTQETMLETINSYFKNIKVHQ